MDWERVKQAFHDALQAADRARALADLDPAVRAEVEELLRAHDAAPAEPQRESPGATIGRYKLLQEIGQGGFGVVWMAEQTEPVRRKVALKILKAGMDTRQVVARFEAERQALAVMDHPGIAKVFDAGETGGRPYFAMELVKGLPITQYCDEARLDTRERLALFARVCHAVQHAHQKGIIHRDLKPSNVLVAIHDGVAVPKVIDFGIAKATDLRLTEKTLFTEFRQMIGTPEYMAPEQAEMSGLDVDTRADIYSLGVMLYELLTGTKPFDLRAAAQRGYEEILRTIREVDPPTPSARILTLGAELLDVAARRRTAPRLLGRLLRRDLDWIVMKALEKDRSRRYETANALALDLRRSLDDEPVAAGPPGPLYRARKYARRHRLKVGAAAGLALALAAGALLSFQGYAEASAQRSLARASYASAAREAADAEAAREGEAAQRAVAETEESAAKTEEAKATAVVNLLKDLLGAADPDEAKGKDYTVRALLDDFDRGLGTRLAEEPEVEAAVRLTMGKAYLGLGLPDRAEPHVEAALEIRRRVAGEPGAAYADALAGRARLDHDRSRFTEAAAGAREVVAIRRRVGEDAALATALDDLADMLRHLVRFEEAEEAGREALALRRAGGGDVAQSLDTLACILREKADLDGAERLLHEAITLRRATGGMELGACVGHLGEVRATRGDFEGAERLQRESLGILREAVGEEHAGVANLLCALGAVRMAQGDLAEAERCLVEGLAMSDRTLGSRAPAAIATLGAVLFRKGDLKGAEARFREALDLRSTTGEHPDMGMALVGLGQVSLARGDLSGAERHMREALDLLRRTLGEKHPQFGETLAMLCQALFMSGDTKRAGELALEAVARHRQHFLLALAGSFLVEEGRPAEAEPLLRECLQLRERLIPEDWTRYNAMSMLGECLAAQDKYAEAEPLLVDGYAKMSPPLMFRDRRSLALDRIVKMYEAWGKPERAAEWRKKGGMGGTK
jgi:tetratricopeptide (TPR) repeat protein